MANITEDRHDARQEGVLNDGVAGLGVYAGTLVSFSAAGKVIAGVPDLPFAGVAMEAVDDGKPVRYWMEGIVDVNCDAAVGVVANVGKRVVVVDNNTVALAASEPEEEIVGKIVGINSTTSVQVKL